MNVTGGTQYVDGLWQFLRKEISRQAVNIDQSSTAARDHLLILVRVAQWRWWYLDANRFELDGGYLRAARARKKSFAVADFAKPPLNARTKNTSLHATG